MKPLWRPTQVKSPADPEVPCTTVVPIRLIEPAAAGVRSSTTRAVVPLAAPMFIRSEVSGRPSVASTASVELPDPLNAAVPRSNTSPVWPLRRSTRPALLNSSRPVQVTVVADVANGATFTSPVLFTVSTPAPKVEVPYANQTVSLLITSAPPDRWT